MSSTETSAVLNNSEMIWFDLQYIGQVIIEVSTSTGTTTATASDAGSVKLINQLGSVATGMEYVK